MTPLLGARKDLLTIIFLPLICLATVLALSNFIDPKLLFALAMILTGGHLVITLTRTHLNRQIFQQYRFRFIGLPILLVLTMSLSSWALYLLVFILPLWDAYHTAMQNFGFARAFDQKDGNDPHQHRTLELIFNHVIASGPLLCGPHFAQLLSNAGRAPDPHFLLTRFPDTYMAHQPLFSKLVFVSLCLFVIVFVISKIRSHEKISWRKYALYASVAITHAYAWTSSSWIEALTIINLYHAIQYYALVWHTEKPNLQQLLKLETSPATTLKLAGLFFGVSFLYGFHRNQNMHVHWTLILFTTFSLLHFYYDSFVWSVRKKQF